MLRSKIARHALSHSALVAGLSSAALITGCVADQPGLTNDVGGAGGQVGSGGHSGSLGSSGAKGGGAEAGTAAGGQNDVAGGGGDVGGNTASAGSGEAGAPEIQGGGGSGGGSGGSEAGGSGGAELGGSGGVSGPCWFHTAAPPAGGAGGGAGTSGAGGTGGGAGSGGAAAVSLSSQVNAFVGGYLADGAGRSLYMYGGDLPGDCTTPPTTTCTADCALSWPPFDAGPRLLGAGLDDARFGSILRADGTTQTTYLGWPLYYYKSDLTLGQLTGQGKGKTWHVAQTNPPAVVILKVGTTKYLADIAGHTLYVSVSDQAGSDSSDPVSTCAGACLDTFKPFNPKKLSVVTSLAQADFSVFARKGPGGLQTAYKGMPLYEATTDLKAGDTTGTAVTGFTAAAP